jgi:hypothetical protein
MQHILTKLIKFVVADGSTYVSFNVMYHNGMNSTKTVLLNVSLYKYKFISELVVLCLMISSILHIFKKMFVGCGMCFMQCR